MSQVILKKTALDMGAWDIEIRHRLQRGKIKLLITHIFFFLLSVSVLFFAF